MNLVQDEANFTINGVWPVAVILKLSDELKNILNGLQGTSEKLAKACGLAYFFNGGMLLLDFIR